ncbi:H-BTB6+-+Bric-a-Brac+Tramtrack+Broad+Complex [Rhynchospora pubera]|uniref:H-BTB6+-+Bric-a-Brac+Tramtrack+Broad+Complex n=1 Tax=Rhynchospora pubera TaxID=906938 RepID=A0AAV8FWM5_9POAL|nr:H-BTB6+-+Bric-a-Brac+Tramtrack+Broad+Complex [Rhynchospora pubera]
MSTSTTSAGLRRTAARRPAIRPTWCCSFSLDPQTPHSKPYSPIAKPHSLTSRRILSPGRVSPIDSDPIDSDPIQDLQEKRLSSVEESRDGGSFRGFRVRLKGREGEVVILSEKEKEMICENSEVFRGLIGRMDLNRGFEIELDGVKGLEGFKATIGLMREAGRNEMRWLAKIGVSGAIEILEVSCSIRFERGIAACLKYVEAAPWTENEEEKLKTLLKTYSLNKTLTQDIVSRFCTASLTSSDNLTVHLIRSITCGSNSKSRRELHTLMNGILSSSSMYQKDIAGLNKEGIYDLCHSVLDSLLVLFKEERPSAERISQQLENLNWLSEILIEKQIGEEFVDLWINQGELISMHEISSPMVRYEMSRVSATIFISLGKGKIHINGEKRFEFFNSWFGPMLLDFGWLRRCPKGLEMRMLEEYIGQALLTLAMQQQQRFFMEWFRVFSEQGRECPNLTRAFQVWWRRSFVRSVGQR